MDVWNVFEMNIVGDYQKHLKADVLLFAINVFLMLLKCSLIHT